MPPAPSRLAFAYVGAAHVALVLAAILAIVSADSLAAYFLAPHTLACVHLVTLGWLTATALGGVYAVLPLALRAPMPVRWPDVVACVLILTGAAGVVAHLDLATYSGVAWSGGAIAVGACWIGVRTVLAIAASPSPRLQQVALTLAFASLVAAATLGAFVAIDRSRPIFAGGHVQTLAGHAHLALVGWLGLLIVGIGHRLLPMLVPAAPATGPRPWLTVCALAGGAVALPVAWLTVAPPSPLPALAAVPIAVGAVLFALDVAALRRRRKPKAKGLPRRDPALVAIAAAIPCVVAAAGLGMALLTLDLGPHLISLYGVLLLVGGLGGLVLGVGLRLWPLLVWRRAFGDGTAGLPTPPGALPSYPLQWVAVVGWSVAVAGLGAGVGLGASGLVRVGGCAWLAAAIAASVNLIVVCRGAWRARRA